MDKIRIYVKGGHGGNGCLSFLREKSKPLGGPNGGDGGKGGDVCLQADNGLSTLLDFSRHPHLLAESGGHGQGGNRAGRDGENLVVLVPVGSVVYKGGRLIVDLSSPGERVMVAQGGRGGRGNRSFKTQNNKAPRLYEKGEPGEEAVLDIELKLIADVGLVGFPNAGKSTFLARVSQARPKIADYPFTTLAPHLGKVRHKDGDFILADIPGLIEEAHRGKGLGHDFLRHVERTRLLIHLIDPLGFSGISALQGIQKIEAELSSYSPALGKRDKILVVNKMDIPGAERVLNSVRGRYRKRRVFGVSAATGKGVSELLDFLLEARHSWTSPLKFLSPTEQDSVQVPAGFEVKRLSPSSFRVCGSFVERLAAMADMRLEESVARLQKTLRKIGVDRALRSAGAQSGDTVFIGPLELEWSQG